MKHQHILTAHPFGGEPFSPEEILELLLENLLPKTRSTWHATNIEKADSSLHLHLILDDEEVSNG